MRYDYVLVHLSSSFFLSTFIYLFCYHNPYHNSKTLICCHITKTINQLLFFLQDQKSVLHRFPQLPAKRENKKQKSLLTPSSSITFTHTQTDPHTHPDFDKRASFKLLQQTVETEQCVKRILNTLLRPNHLFMCQQTAQHIFVGTNVCIFI